MITNLLLGGVLLSAPVLNEYNSIGSNISYLLKLDGLNVSSSQTIEFYINENNEVSGIEFTLNLYSATFSIGTSSKLVAIAEIYEQNIPLNSIVSIYSNIEFNDISRTYIGINQTYTFTWGNNGTDRPNTFTNQLYHVIQFSDPYDTAPTISDVQESDLLINLLSAESSSAPCAPCDTDFFSFIGAMFDSTIQILNFEIFEGFKLWYILGIPLFISLIFGVLKLLR